MRCDRRALGFTFYPSSIKEKNLVKMAPPADNTTKYDTELRHTMMQDEKHKEAKRREKFMNFMMLLCSMKYIQQFLVPVSEPRTEMNR